MQIGLSFNCNISDSEMQPVSGGAFCNNCQKIVVDYSAMTDAEMLAHIKKHGLAHCGSFREDQLYRNIKAPRKKISIGFYLPLLFIFLLRPFHAFTQCKQQAYVQLAKSDTTKAKPAPACDQSIMIAKPGHTISVKRFGTTAIAREKKTRFNLFKRKKK